MVWRRNKRAAGGAAGEASIVAGDREAWILELGNRFLEKIREQAGSIFRSGFWQSKALGWYLANEDLKVQMLRFVDVLPVLSDPRDVVRHLKEYFPRDDARLPATLRAGVTLSGLGLGWIASSIADFAVKTSARHFISGENVAEAVGAIEKLVGKGASYTVDILGEATRSEAEAEACARAYLDLIDGLAAAKDRCGDVNVSVKLSSLSSRFEPADPEGTSDAVRKRLRPILWRAIEAGGRITLDMEQYAFREVTFQIFRDLLGEEEFRGTDALGIAFQTYLRDALPAAESLLSFLRTLPAPPWVRLVKGAYWDWEVIHALANSWPIPVFTAKERTDRAFEAVCKLFLENWRHVRTAVASHNLRSIAAAAYHAQEYGVPDDHWEFQVLHGMGAPIMTAILETGYRVRVYVPYGPLIPGMAYLVRRILENTANESFLRRGFSENVAPEELFKAPAEVEEPSFGVRRIAENHPPADFSLSKTIAAMRQALERVAGSFPRRVPLLVGADEVWKEPKILSVRPDRPDHVVGEVASAGAAEADQAVGRAREAFPAWSRRPAEERQAILRRGADLLAERRFDLAALMVYEVGKTWREADGDLVEAIDFLRYYGSEAARLAKPEPLTTLPGEINEYVWRPLGVGAVIAPWNFPLAIFTGMTAAAIAAGNTVVTKPASVSPVIAYEFCRILREAGVPPGVVNFVPGPGGAVGNALVRHHAIDFIAFTGSREVGLAIARGAAETPGRGIKKVILELGGKNAIIIDSDADLDEAVSGVIASAFGFQGQKCSACSRVIVLPGIREAFTRRLVEAARSITIGPPEDPSSMLGPLVDEHQLRTVREYVGIGKREATLLLEVTDVPREGYFHGPVIFDAVPPAARIAQEEIFGPVLSILWANDLDQALSILNGTPYALTGGIYSRSPGSIARAKAEAQVGNLYVNRGITGAIVGRQPFGGFRMSGIGSKAGGPDYVKQFMTPVSLTENTVRRGTTEFAAYSANSIVANHEAES
jgi:RHH-type transcriptional regulator, proline utilization regulon repressor / proline dehydrogenase / delta 1-pyrroline-5-carboxylate dehydrogenase